MKQAMEYKEQHKNDNKSMLERWMKRCLKKFSDSDP